MNRHDELPLDRHATSLFSSEEDKNPLSNKSNLISPTIEDRMRHFHNNSDPKFFPELMTTCSQTKGLDRYVEPDPRELKKDFLDIFETSPSKVLHGQIADRILTHEELRMKPKGTILSIFSPTSNRASFRENSLTQGDCRSPASILENSHAFTPKVVTQDRHKQRRAQVFKRIKQSLSQQTTSRAINLIHDKSHSRYKDEIFQKRSQVATRSRRKSHFQTILKKHAAYRRISGQSRFFDIVLNTLIYRRQDIIDKVVLKFKKNFSWLRVVGNLFSTAAEIIRAPVKPDDTFHFIWDFILMVFILHDLIVIPFNISFSVPLEGESFSNVFDNIETCFFLFDIVLNFRTAFYKDGNLILNFKSIAKNYLKGWFWIDLVSSFPFIWIAQLISGTSTNSVASFKATARLLRVVKIFRFAKVIRVIRIIKLKQILGNIEDLMHSHTAIHAILSLVRLSIFIFFLAHWCACFWYLLGASSTEDNWLGASHLEGADLKDQYTASLYFSITTMLTVGYGDIAPKNVSERLFTIFMMLMGGGVFGYVMNSIATIAQSIEGEKAKMKRQMYTMSRFMQRKGLTKDVQSKVKKYMELINENEEGINKEEAEMLQQLSGNLREEIFKQINGKFLNQAKIFSENFSSRLLSALSLILEEKTFYPQEVIFGPNNTDYAVYFVSKGATGLFYEHFDHLIEMHKRGDYFGEVSFFGGHPEPVIARSVNFSHIIYLKRSDFITVSEKYEHDKESFHMIKDKTNLYEDYMPLKTVCQICEQRLHLSYKCPRVHYIPDREAIIRTHILEQQEFNRTFIRRSKREANVWQTLSKLQDSGERICSNYASIISKEGPLSRRYFKFTHSEVSEADMHQVTSLSLRRGDLASKPSLYNMTYQELYSLGEESPGKFGERSHRSPKIIRNQPRSFRDLDLEDKEEFDKAKNYQIYFTHNNLAKLIERTGYGLNMRREIGEAEYLKTRLGGFFQKMVLVRKSVDIQGDIWKTEAKQR